MSSAIRFFRGTSNRPPAPSSLPHTLARFASDPCGCVVGLTQELGDVVRLGFGGYVLISHPDHLQYVLETNPRNYWRGRRAHRRSGGVFGNGLAYADGDLWRRQRRMMTPAFSPKALPRYLPVMVDETLAVLERWKSAARRGAVIDAKAELHRLAQNVIGGTMFQTDVRDQGAEIAAAMSVVGSYIGRSTRAPVHVPLAVPTPSNLRFRRAVRTLDRMMYSLIEEERRNDQPAGSLLSRLVWARDDETGEAMSDRQIRDELINVFVAGHESSANALAFTLALLSQHPEARLRLEAEVRDTLSGAHPRPEDLSRLTFTERVIRESLRLYPPSWMLIRELREDDSIGGFRIPARTSLLISPYVTHRRPELWDDPERFDPDRFAPERRPPTHKFAWAAFGGGPRVCLGQSFAMAELKVILALVAQRCRLDLEEGTVLHPEPRLTLEPRGELRMSPRWLDG